jgi:hypothetical protein
MSEQFAPLAGGCLCGGVRFELTEPPVSSGWCHCTRCRRRTGGEGSVQARIAPGSLRILQGEELLRAYDPKDGFAKVFCSACGSSLWSQNPVDLEAISVRLGAFDDDPGIRPSYRQFVAYLAPWASLPDDGLPRYPERRP